MFHVATLMTANVDSDPSKSCTMECVSEGSTETVSMFDFISLSQFIFQNSDAMISIDTVRNIFIESERLNINFNSSTNYITNLNMLFLIIPN